MRDAEVTTTGFYLRIHRNPRTGSYRVVTSHPELFQAVLDHAREVGKTRRRQSAMRAAYRAKTRRRRA